MNGSILLRVNLSIIDLTKRLVELINYVRVCLKKISTIYLILLRIT